MLGAAAPAAPPPWKILVFTKTAEFRHDSIPAAIAAVQQLGTGHGFGVDQTEDAGAFTDANLAQYRAVVFLLTTGDVLDDTQQGAFQRYIEHGGGFVGVHSAADTEHGWPWYGSLVGTYFLSHPAIQQATVHVADPTAPGAAGLPAAWTRVDEWYDFTSNPRPSVHVIATVDESTYDAGPDAMGADHPIAWWHDFDGGRSWYTAMGHTTESYSDPLFLSHLLGGIDYAAGEQPPAPSPTHAAPAITHLVAGVRGHRLTVSAVVRSCEPCRVAATLAGGGHRRTLQLRRRGSTFTSAATTIAPGRWLVVVSATDTSSGSTRSVRRSVRIR